MSLNRFVEAQDGVIDSALSELRGGFKMTHWMWFIFPQIAGLGRSETAKFYALRDLDEAKAYAAHDTLGPRLIDCAHAMMSNAGMAPDDVLGDVDAIKLRSCATLFSQIDGAHPVFQDILDEFYQGRPCRRTLEKLAH